MTFDGSHHLFILINSLVKGFLDMKFLIGLLLSILAVVAKEDVISCWTNLLLENVRDAKLSTPAAARTYAIFYEAIDEALHHVDCSEKGSRPLVIAGAARYVLADLLPSGREEYDSLLQAEFEEECVKSIARENRLDIIREAEKQASEVLSTRLFDEFLKFTPYCLPNCCNCWIPTPPEYQKYPVLPNFGNVDPFAIENVEKFVPGNPPSCSSPAFKNDLLEVFEIGGEDCSKRSPQETLTAKFWDAPDGTVTVSGYWIKALLDILQKKNDILNLRRAIHSLRLLTAAMADATIVTWRTKYEYETIRPVSVINNGWEHFEARPDWTPLLITPAHPEYISGHSTICHAAATALESLYKPMEFTICSDGEVREERVYHSFECAADECGLSRILGGVHFGFSVDEGKNIGEYVGSQVAKKLLKD